MSALAYADPANPVILPEEGATSINANTINQNMGPDATVWVQNTFGSEIELNSGSPSIPANSEGMIIGGTDDTAKIKVQTGNLQNIFQTTVNKNGLLTVSGASGTPDYFDTTLIINGEGDNLAAWIKKGTFSMRNGSKISISGGALDFDGNVRVGYDDFKPTDETLPLKSVFEQSGGTVTLKKSDSKLIIGYKTGAVGEYKMSGGTLTSASPIVIGEQAGSEGTFEMTGGTLTGSALTLGNQAKNDDYAAATGTATFTNVTNQFSGDINVGSYGIGTLTLNSASLKTNGVFYVANHTGSKGTANLNSESSVTAKSHIIVGKSADGTLTLDNSSIESTEGYLYIGQNNGSSGNVTLKNGSSLSFPKHSIRVGEAGTGVLNIQPGSTYTGCEIFLGNASTAEGTLNIDKGTITSKSIVVGNAGKGYLNIGQGLSVGEDQVIEDNATTVTISSGGFFIGGQESDAHNAGIGTANISNTTMTVPGDFTVGNYGKGTLTMDNSTATISGAMYIANHTGSEGTATLNNVTFTNTLGNVFVGKSGTGTLTLDSTDLSTNGYLVVGGGVDADGKTSGATGTGTINLTNGATLSNTSHSMRIGESGKGTFNVKSNSTLNSPSQDIHLGHASVGDGTLNIDGGTVNSKIVYVGRAGTGALEIKNGGVLNAGTNSLYLGYDASSVGTFNMSGSDTTVTAGALYVGNKAAKVDDDNKPIANVATISGGSFTSSGNIFVGAEANSLGVLNVVGGTLTGNNELRVGNSGAGTMTITGGDVTVTGLANVGNSAGSTGMISIGNGTLTLSNSGNTFRIGREGTGTVEVLEGGKLIVENTTTQLGYKSGGNGTLTINGGTANLNALQVGFASGSTGELKVLGGKLNVFNEINVGYDGTGSAAISGGVVTTGDFVVKSGMSAALNGGTLNVASYVNEGTTTFNGSTINLGSGGVINSTGTFTATSGSVVVNPGSYYSESDQVLIGRFMDYGTADSVNNMTTVPEGWSTAAIELEDNGPAIVVAQYGSAPTGVKIWNGGEANMSSADSWSGDTSNNTGYVLGGTNKFKDFAGDLVLVDGTNTFSINAPVPSGHLLVNDGGTTTYGSNNIGMNGTLVVNGGTFQTTYDKNLVITGSESAPAYLEVNGGTLSATHRLTIGDVKSTDNKPTAKAVINGGYVQIGSSNGGGLHIGDNDKDGVIAELKINGGSIQINNSQPIHIGGGKNSNGTLTMTGGNITTGGAVYLGGNKESGTGTLTMTNGSFVIGGKVYLGYNSKSTGTIDFSGGTFTALGAMDLGREANSTGTINISGGTFTVAGEVIVGRGADSTGTITISKKSLTTLGTLTVATGDRSTGTIDVSKGKLTVNNIQLGRADAGESAQLNISEGGVVEITNSLYGVENSLCGIVTISNTGQMILNSSYSDASKAGIRELSGFNIEGVGGDGSGAMLFVKSLDSSVPITLTNDATIGINPGAVFTQREAINSVPKRSATQPALTVTGGGTLVLTNSELGSLDELTVDGDGTTVKIDNPGNTTNVHLSSVILNSGVLEVCEGTILDPGYGDDELPTTVAIEGDGRVILKGALLLDAYTTEKETGMDKLDFSGFDGDVTLANPLNLTVHLNNASDFLGQVVTLDWLIDDAPGDLYDINNVNLTLVNDEGISFLYWLNADGSLTFGDHNAIPEPSTWALLILGAAGLLYWRKRKN